MKNIKPETWRNIPVPLTEIADKLVKYSMQASSISDTLKQYNDDLTQILQNFFNYFDANNDEIRDQVQNKFLILNQKCEGEISAAMTKLTNYTEKMKTTSVDASN